MGPAERNTDMAREELERVLSTPGFARNERLSRFLRFVVERHLEGRGDEIKESLLAVEVFGRPPDYDPKEDSIVRTEAGRLRSRLTDYYAGEGRGDPLIIEVPKGGYTPVLRYPTAVHAQPRDNRLRLTLLIGSLAIALTAAGLWWSRTEGAPIRIAVLPLENLSTEADSDYFAHGLTDEIITRLAAIEGLAVRSRTSSLAFKGRLGDVREAGKQLGVDYILEGSVLRAGDRLRINARLIGVRDDVPLWSGRFDREFKDVFTIQDEISLGIVNNLRLKLGRGRRRYETSVEAYDVYLRARALRPLPSIARFEEVLAKDPSFAPAHAGLAAAYAFRSVQFPEDHPVDELAKMRAAAEKAILLDPLLPEAHAALGAAFARDGHWEQSEKSFRRAIDLDPNRSSTYVDYGYWLLTVLGRVEGALQQLRIARQLDSTLACGGPVPPRRTHRQRPIRGGGRVLSDVACERPATRPS